VPDLGLFFGVNCYVLGVIFSRIEKQLNISRKSFIPHKQYATDKKEKYITVFAHPDPYFPTSPHSQSPHLFHFLTYNSSSFFFSHPIF
jgi:hypothetical protein